MKTIKSYLPIFQGFYNTHFDNDGVIDNAMYNIEEDGLKLEFADIKWELKDYMDRVANKCISSIWNYFKHGGYTMDIEFEKVYSPREYNFENDVIYCTYSVSDKDFTELVDYLQINLEAFREFLDNKYSSRSGFISFFSADPQKWFEEYLNEDSDKFGRTFAGIIEFYLINEGYIVDDMLSDCQEELSYIDYKILTPS